MHATDFMNTFVTVSFDLHFTRVTCKFHGNNQINNCSIAYGGYALRNSTMESDTVFVNLIQPVIGHSFKVTATNGTHTVLIEGTISRTG